MTSYALYVADLLSDAEPTEADFDEFAARWRSGRPIPAPLLVRISPSRRDHVDRLRKRGVPVRTGVAGPR